MSVYWLIAAVATAPIPAKQPSTTVVVPSPPTTPFPATAVPPSKGKESPPIPKSNPGVWANTLDYPSRALMEEREGITAFRLDVAPDGRVANCAITSSSGHADLDQTTCSNITRRAQFYPAQDKKGQPIAGTYSNRVRWQIPTSVPIDAFPKPPSALQYGWTRLLPEDWPKAALEEKRFGETQIELAISSSGTLVDCKIVRASGHPDLDKASCDIAFARAKFSPALDLAGMPTEGRIRTSLKWEARPKLAVTPAGGVDAFDLMPKPGSTRLTFIVGKDGTFSDCEGEVTGASGLDPKFFCNARFKQKPYTDEMGRLVARRVKITSKIEVEDLPE
jgi:TonB family protein